MSLFPETVTLFSSPIITPDLIIGVIGLWGLSEFRNGRIQKRSDVAALIFGEILSFVDYVEEIRQNPGLYEYLGYYPLKIPEIGEKSEPCRERPSRLIINRVGEFEDFFKKQVPHLGGREVTILLQYLADIRKNCFTLSNALYAQVGNTKEIAEAARPNIEKSRNKIIEITNEMKSTVTPIINGYNAWRRLIESLPKWICVVLLVK